MGADRLLPLPLPHVSAEERQDRALREFDEIDQSHADYIRLSREWEDMGTQVWLWLVTVALNFLRNLLNKDGTETTASGYSLPLPARPIGIDGNGPKNWSHSLLRKRVMTPHDGT